MTCKRTVRYQTCIYSSLSHSFSLLVALWPFSLHHLFWGYNTALTHQISFSFFWMHFFLDWFCIVFHIVLFLPSWKNYCVVIGYFAPATCCQLHQPSDQWNLTHTNLLPVSCSSLFFLFGYAMFGQILIKAKMAKTYPNSSSLGEGIRRPSTLELVRLEKKKSKTRFSFPLWTICKKACIELHTFLKVTFLHSGEKHRRISIHLSIIYTA